MNVFRFNEKEALKRLCNDKALLSRLVETFLGELKIFEDNLAQALSDNDIEQAIQCTHRLKGASANIGLECIQQFASDLERDLRSTDQLSSLGQTIDALKEHIKVQARPGLNDWLVVNNPNSSFQNL